MKKTGFDYAMNAITYMIMLVVGIHIGLTIPQYLGEAVQASPAIMNHPYLFVAGIIVGLAIVVVLFELGNWLIDKYAKKGAVVESQLQ